MEFIIGFLIFGLMIGIIAGIVREIKIYRQFKDPNAPTIKQRIIENYKKHPNFIKVSLIVWAVLIVLMIVMLNN